MIIDKGIPIKNVYYMLTYAFKELKRNNYEQIAGEDFKDVHDLFAEILSLGIAAYSGGYPFSISGDIRSLPS